MPNQQVHGQPCPQSQALPHTQYVWYTHRAPVCGDAPHLEVVAVGPLAFTAGPLAHTVNVCLHIQAKLVATCASRHHEAAWDACIVTAL